MFKRRDILDQIASNSILGEFENSKESLKNTEKGSRVWQKTSWFLTLTTKKNNLLNCASLEGYLF